MELRIIKKSIYPLADVSLKIIFYNIYDNEK